jgi:hypothetical protein
MQFPTLGLIKQKFPPSRSGDPAVMVRGELERIGLLGPVKPGDSVLITAGSRGIECLPLVMKSLVEVVREKGGRPWLMPAMGSHGGGDPKAQAAIVRGTGLTEDFLGVPIREDLETIKVGTVRGGHPIYADRAAAQADHIILVNRIKEHTEYIGRTESGLLKMAVVGLGRWHGAESMHKLAVNITYEKAIHIIAEVFFEQLNILGGLAILEDHANHLDRVEAIPAAEIFDREPELLEESKLHHANLPFEELDVLLVDEIGKDISGAGFDTKVIGRIMNIYEQECRTPRITRIVLRDMSAKSEGNATGIGLADFVTKRAVDKVDFRVTNTNCLTAVAPEKARLPMTLPSDKAALEAAFQTIGLWTPETVRLAWIPNTLSLEWLAVSPALLVAARDRGDLEVYDSLFDLSFDEQGNLPGLNAWLSGKELR